MGEILKSSLWITLSTVYPQIMSTNSAQKIDLFFTRQKWLFSDLCVVQKKVCLFLTFYTAISTIGASHFLRCPLKPQ